MSTLILLLIVALLEAIILIFLLLNRNGNSKGSADKLTALLQETESLDRRLRQELAANRQELGDNLRSSREELSGSFKLLSESTAKSLERFEQRFQNLIRQNEEKADALNTAVNQRFENIRETLENKLRALQDSNAVKLEEMRKVVDEKLQESVEKRFNDSFRLISERLEQVHKGLGEMQSIASGVGDLKRVLTNVKTRGNLGEIQLGAILEQYLAPDQFVVNAQTKPNTTERVEFAVKLPGKDRSEPVLLPIDSKFPIEDYQRLISAGERGDAKEVQTAANALETAVKKFAADIRNKYLNPPVTTDFALMFVPSEGLYAEILRRPGLFELLQRDYRVTVVGPANLVAFLNSLQMGFRTLAIEKRSSEVWTILGAVKTEFGKFSEVLDKMRSKLDSAVKEIDNAGRRSRAIERRLRSVEELPECDSKAVLTLEESPAALTDSAFSPEIDG